MEFSEETIRAAGGIRSMNELAQERRRNFVSSSYEHDFSDQENVLRLEQSLIWNGMLCTPTFSTDEAIIHCRVRKADDVDLVPGMATSDREEG